MIPADLLDQLREKDPELWGEIDTGTKMLMWWDRKQDGSIVCQHLCYNGMDAPMQEAWLQHCLQEAIRARGWSGWVGRTALICFAEIHTKGAASRFENNEIFYGQGDTESEALGWAYLAVIEAIRP